MVSNLGMVRNESKAAQELSNYQRLVVRLPSNFPQPGRARVILHQPTCVEQFFSTVLNTLPRQLDLTKQRPFLLASPGFVARIKDNATTTGNKPTSAPRPRSRHHPPPLPSPFFLHPKPNLQLQLRPTNSQVRPLFKQATFTPALESTPDVRLSRRLIPPSPRRT